MRTITKEVYTFDELSDEAKKKVMDTFSDINVDYDWWESVYDDAEMVGLRIEEFDTYRKSIGGEFCVLGDAEQCAGLILANHGEKCETYKLAEAYLKDLAAIEKKYPKREDEEREEFTEEAGVRRNEFLEDLLNEYLSTLEKEYDYLTSEEAIIETIRVNDYEFYADGKSL